MGGSGEQAPEGLSPAGSLALQAGIHPKVVTDRLGHATIAITIDTYSHVIRGMQERAIVPACTRKSLRRPRGACQWQCVPSPPPHRM